MVDRVYPLLLSTTLLVAWQACLWLTPSGRAFLSELDGAVSHAGNGRALSLVGGLAWLGAAVWFWNDWVVWRDAVDASTRAAATTEVAGVGLTLAKALSAGAATILSLPALALVRSALRRQRSPVSSPTRPVQRHTCRPGLSPPASRRCTSSGGSP